MAEGPGDRRYPSGGFGRRPGVTSFSRRHRGPWAAFRCALPAAAVAALRGTPGRISAALRGSNARLRRRGAVPCGVPCERGRGASAVREPLLPLTLCRRSAPAVRVVPQDGALSLWCTVTERSAGCGSNAGNGGEALGEPLWWGTERRGGSRGGCDLRPCRARGCRRPAPPGRVPVPP